MKMEVMKKKGLVRDLWPHIQLMKISGMWIFNYYENNELPLRLFRIFYSLSTTVLMLAQFSFILGFLAFDCIGGDQLASGTITSLFFAHSIGKFFYFALRSGHFYRLIGIWNQVIPVKLYLFATHKRQQHFKI